MTKQPKDRNSERDTAHKRDALLLGLLKTPPQPRPKRKRPKVSKRQKPPAKQPRRRV